MTRPDADRDSKPDAVSMRRWMPLALGTGLLLLLAGGVMGAEGLGQDWLAGLVTEVRAQQQAWHRDLTAAVRGLGDGYGLAATWALIAASFAYGVFHAAGPGHGKAVIAAYAVASPHKLRRALWLSFAAAMVQATTAVLLVGGALLLIRGATRWSTMAAERWLEPASYAAIAVLGAWVVLRGLRMAWKMGAWKTGRAASNAAHQHDHHHGHHGHDHHSHDHHHDDPHPHGEDHACCGHAHGPTAAQVARLDSWRSVAALAVAIGIRPCSGALMVLVVAHGLGLWMAGVMSTYAMGLGTALTVAVIAAGARAARLPLAAVASRLPVSPALLGSLGAVLAGGVILALGAVLLFAAVTAPVHPLLGR